jgi:outer membrane protein assembly factor BamD
MTAVPVTPASGKTGNSLGVEVMPAGSNAPATGSTTYPGDAAKSDDNGGLKPVGASSTPVLPPVEQPAAATDTINDVKPGSQPAVTPGTQASKATYDKSTESSNKHKKKTGLDKLNPF